MNGRVMLPNEHRPLQYFNQYLRMGYYPFFKETGYWQRLKAVVDTTLEVDIPQFANYTTAKARKLKLLLYIIAQSVPFKPNMQKIAEEVGVSRNELADIFVYMEKAGLIRQLRSDTMGIRLLGKAEKVYLQNTNLAYALSHDEPDIGNIRETFFFALTSVTEDTTASSISDFTIGDYTFEVGGKHKTSKQIKDVAKAYVVKDDVESAAMNILPLWTFGMMY